MLTAGDADSLEQMTGLLRKIDGEIAAIYAGKSGRPASVFRDAMKQETWMNAEEAIAARLADSILEEPRAASNHRPDDVAARLRQLDRDQAAGADSIVHRARQRVTERNYR